jgi:hypothetical protein
MKLNDAKRKLDTIINIPLGEWMTPTELEGIIRGC